MANLKNVSFLLLLVFSTSTFALNQTGQDKEMQYKTQLKFTKSKKTGSWVSFVSKIDGKLVGVSEDESESKKVCVASYKIAPTIEPGVLYDVSLQPMRDSRLGYIVTEVVEHSFDAEIISSIVKGVLYCVEVKFGGRSILYDPLFGKRDNVRTIDGVTKTLLYRKDIANLPQVIEDFQHAAQVVYDEYIADGFTPRR